MAKGDDDHISKLPDDVLVRILSVFRYDVTVRTAAVSRRWEDVVHTQLPKLRFCLLRRGLGTSRGGTPSEQRLQGMERSLRRRCGEGNHYSVKSLVLFYRKDVPMECRYADEFIALANAHKLILHVKCGRELPDDDAGAWCLELPPATTELQVLPYWYAVRPPQLRGSGVSTLRSLTLKGPTVLCQDFLLAELPSLEHLHIGECTIAASINITSENMPRLRHLVIKDVCVMTKDTRAEINVLADELRTLRVSCETWSSTNPMTTDEDKLEAFCLRVRFQASFTTYSSFRLRAPRLRVFNWSCTYADEVCIESVGHLSDVVIKLAAGLKPRQYNEEVSYVTVDQRDKLMTDILTFRGLCLDCGRSTGTT
ncbi:hypothetical protein PR202_ga14537 [Eleusine coracana subsp. coracana]|uniref:F-box domain-containing protein n=1 Tax=Eleusine coracana subsp. coracana TaxID=191504 RepID=A0AAV5CGW6_ELECO|nr:hypothetical protein PR202_ga14537 [Eleusine coracana subsp. coracana]